MSNDVLRYLADKNNEEIKILADDLARGHAKDHGEYKQDLLHGLSLYSIPLFFNYIGK